MTTTPAYTAGARDAARFCVAEVCEVLMRRSRQRAKSYPREDSGSRSEALCARKVAAQLSHESVGRRTYKTLYATEAGLFARTTLCKSLGADDERQLERCPAENKRNGVTGARELAAEFKQNGVTDGIAACEVKRSLYVTALAPPREGSRR